MKRIVTAAEKTHYLRIARLGEFDNGRVIHKYTRMTDSEAEKLAKQKSLKSDDIFYVYYDNIMRGPSNNYWYHGKSYSYDEVSKFIY